MIKARRLRSADRIVASSSAESLLGFQIGSRAVSQIAIFLQRFINFSLPARYSGPAPRLVPFTSSPGVKGSPAFSPDGNELAFSWQGEKSKNPDVHNIYVQLVGTTTPLRLTHTAADDECPTWSPDGRFIAFLRTRQKEEAYYIVPALGGPERKLAGSYADPLGASLAWSPDGKE